MSKAEEAALKVYPQKIEGDSRGSYDLNELNRQKFLLGYHQAEKDMELTWKDVAILQCLLHKVEREFAKGMYDDKTYKGYCQEVLKQFKENKL